MSRPPRITAEIRVQRLLALLSWCAAHDGPTLTEVSARFGIPQPQLRQELDLANMVGADAGGPDDMPIEVTVADGRVFVFLHSFTRPLRLTPEEGLALVAAGAAARRVLGDEADGPLATGLAKLARVLDVEPDQALAIDLGLPPTDIVATLRRAADEHRQVRLDYYSFGRDEHTDRTVDPWQVFTDQGAWYVVGQCHQAGGVRSFRLDRIADVEVLDTRFDPPAEVPAGLWHSGEALPLVTLELPNRDRWVAETYPVASVDDLGTGRFRVTLPTAATPWLERLLLRLGPEAAVVDIDERLGGPDLGAAAARRVLARYRSTDSA